MTPLSYHSPNLSLIALETMRLLVQKLEIHKKNKLTRKKFVTPDLQLHRKIANLTQI